MASSCLWKIARWLAADGVVVAGVVAWVAVDGVGGHIVDAVSVLSDLGKVVAA
jgi:hypothetical protein